METKKSKVNADSQQKGKKVRSTLATAAGMGIASVAGATIGHAFSQGQDQDNPEEELVDVNQKEVLNENKQQQEEEHKQATEHTQQQTKSANDSHKDADNTDSKSDPDHPKSEPDSPKSESDDPNSEPDVEKDPESVSEKILGSDEIDESDSEDEYNALEMRTLTDSDGNEVEAMIFVDGEGNEIALIQSDSESGVFNVVVDPNTLESVSLPNELSYSRGDFEELLNSEGGYITPEATGPMFADNDDISEDIKTTDDGEMLAQNDSEPAPDIAIDEPDIDESDEELIAQLLLNDEANGDTLDVNEDQVDIIDSLLDEKEEEDTTALNNDEDEHESNNDEEDDDSNDDEEDDSSLDEVDNDLAGF